MSSRQRGECRICHKLRDLPAKGLCSSCYQREHKRDTPQVDCFARGQSDIRKACRVMEGPCLAERGVRCPFQRTREDYARSKARAIARIQSLPEAQRDYIVATYLMQKREGTT